MLDGGMPSELGTTMLTGIRAEKGWWTCEKDLWPSNVDLTLSKFEDWQKIPDQAWEDARKKRIRSNKARVDSRSSSTVNLNGRTFRLWTNYHSHIMGEDKQFDIVVMDTEFECIHVCIR